MTPAERAYVLADNKLALNAGWDEELLALELKALMEADIDFDIGITGFPIRSPFLRAAAPATFGARAASSDLRRCAQSQCGRRPNDVEKAEMVFTDPPYNVVIDGNVNGLGKIRHREFAMASGERVRTSSQNS